jgi:anti-anti-sigma factor
MKLTFEKDGDITEVIVKGDLTEETEKEFRETLKKEINHGAKLKINLDKLAHIDKHGYEAMGSVIAAANSNRTNITFYVEEKDVYKMLKKSDYFDFIPISRNEKEAKRELSKPLRKK